MFQLHGFHTGEMWFVPCQQREINKVPDCLSCDITGRAYLHLHRNKTYLGFGKLGPFSRRGPGDLNVRVEMCL